MMSFFKAGAVVLAMMAAFAGARADDYPTRPVRILVPYPAGGPSDVAARLFAPFLSRELGQPVIIENRSGGGGVSGTEGVLRDSADGYTLVVGGTASLVLLPAAKHVQYDPLKDFTPLGQIWYSPMGLVVRSQLKLKTLEDFIAYAKANPGKITMGSAGTGTVSHLAIVLLAQRAGIDLTHVPYRSTALAMNDILADQIDGVISNAATTGPLIDMGKADLLAVTVPKRVPQVPNVPTMAEKGLPDVVVDNWFGVLVPSRAPTAIQQKLKTAVRAAQADPAYIAALDKHSSTINTFGSDALAALLREEGERWVPIVKLVDPKNIQ